ARGELEVGLLAGHELATARPRGAAFDRVLLGRRGPGAGSTTDLAAALDAPADLRADLLAWAAGRLALAARARRRLLLARDLGLGRLGARGLVQLPLELDARLEVDGLAGLDLDGLEGPWVDPAPTRTLLL